MQSLKKPTIIRSACAAIAASSLLIASACGGSPEPSSAPTVPSNSSASSPGSNSSTDSNGSGTTSGFLGTAALPESVQNATPTAISERIGSCVESDDAKPVIFGSESVHGFTCVMSVGNSGAAMVTTAEDPDTVGRINAKAESIDGYTPYEIPGKRAFSGVNNGAAFVMVVDDASQVYQEYVFANVAADQAQPLIDEVIQAYQ